MIILRLILDNVFLPFWLSSFNEKKVMSDLQWKRGEIFIRGGTFKKTHLLASPRPNLSQFSEPQNPWIYEFYVVQKRHAIDFKAPQLWKASSGLPSSRRNVQWKIGLLKMKEVDFSSRYRTQKCVKQRREKSQLNSEAKFDSHFLLYFTLISLLPLGFFKPYYRLAHSQF